jgi:hypothetical protein
MSNQTTDKTIRTDLTRTAADRCREAIDRGDREAALAGVDAILAEAKPIHDLYGDLVASLLGYIARTQGEDAIEKAWRYVGEEIWTPVVLSMKEGGTAALAEVFAMFLRSHGYDFVCEEDDEKYAFIANYCPSGGRQMKEGKNEDSPLTQISFGVTKDAHDWSFGQAGVPYYCAHTKLWFDIMPREAGWDVFGSEFGKQFTADGHATGEPCKMFIYKK